MVGIPIQRNAASLNIGKHVCISEDLAINAGCLTIGDYSYIGSGRISSLSNTKIRIGKFTSIANGIQIIGALHRSHISTYALPRMLSLSDRENYKHGRSRGDISIGNDVWIGVNTTILSGVNILDGAIVGAGSVVTKDVLPYAVVAGVPARVIRMRFSESEISMLLSEQWWNWDYKKIVANMSHFYDESLSVSEFIKLSKEYEKP